MRVERIGLEDHGHVAIAAGHMLDFAISDQDATGGDILETGDHSQRRRLAATRWPEKNNEFSGFDREIDGVNGDRVAKTLGQILEMHPHHHASPR